MSGYRREILKDAALLGFVFVGYNGRNHIRLHNAQVGASYTVAFSPSDFRGRRNAIAAMQRLSGRKLAHQKNGKHAAP